MKLLTAPIIHKKQKKPNKMNLDTVRCGDISLKAISVLHPGDALVFPDRRDLWFFTVVKHSLLLAGSARSGSSARLDGSSLPCFFFLLLLKLHLDSPPRSLPAFLFHCIPDHRLFYALGILDLKS